MNNNFKNNAFHILGLDVCSSAGEIAKRSKEIINRLNVGDCPEYSNDVKIFKDFRTSEMVKDATQKLQSPKKRIKECFFWFRKFDDVDDAAIKMLQNEQYFEASQAWKSVQNPSYFHKKNLAILYCLMLLVDDNKSVLQESIKLWNELINSDKFWDVFASDYRDNDKQVVSQDTVDEFKNSVVSYVSEVYTDLHQIHNNADYIGLFQNTFSFKGVELDERVLQPIYKIIKNNIEELETTVFSKNDKLVQSGIGRIKEIIVSVKNEYAKLSELNLYDNTESKLVRDEFSSALRSIAIDLHNDLKEIDISSGFISIAYELAGTDSYKGKIQVDLNTINENKDFRDMRNEQSKIAPPMFTLNGFGVRIYGDILYIVALFVPICPLSKYLLIEHGDGKYSFIKKLELPAWAKYWKYAFFGVIVFWIICANASGSNGNGKANAHAGRKTVAYDDGNNHEGQYKCSKEHTRKSDLLLPGRLAEMQLEETSNKLKKEKLEIEALIASIDNGYYIDEADRKRMVEEAASKIVSFDEKFEEHDVKVDEYNAAIQAHNNYLISHCTKRK